MGKRLDQDSRSRIIEAAIRTAHTTFGGYVPTKLLQEVVYARDDGNAFAQPVAAKCREHAAKRTLAAIPGT